ncbi:diguanylate cyclase (GGDEF) domain-containing protein [Methylophilus rhizosphaerae]|uniref:diguanylate cyclase n=1 Tax=Methylophilus rhizosphaerae TaxID=492660 RepID=A0A1G9EZU7_9PROT|nr:GGDEF domain-containing protein [Methylophilus rhizosphaerae]SDK81588.1 diguanylate cyclase (GGDEF) domain-containing protein [Methylophilus rhizosphaerae]
MGLSWQAVPVVNLELSTGYFVDIAEQLLSGILDTLPLQVAVIDQASNIVYVNQAWRTFGLFYGLELDTDWFGIAYLDICRANEDTNQPQLLHGIQKVLNGKAGQFSIDYLCHTPTKQPTWLTLHVQPMSTNLADSQLFLLSLTNITHHKQVEDRISALTLTDPLTGLANRRQLEQIMRDEWSRAIRHQSSLSVMMIDADHFKQLNDNMGHAAGDECLKKLAGILKHYTNRPGDLAARYGGEEFVLILGQTTQQEAIKIAERIRQKVMELDIRFAGHRLMTVSIGIASLSTQQSHTTKEQHARNQSLNFSEDEHLLIEQADKALYVAKKQGRNRVEVYDKHHRLTVPLTA